MATTLLESMVTGDGADHLEIAYDEDTGACYAIATITARGDEIAAYSGGDLAAAVRAEADALPRRPEPGEEVLPWPYRD